MFSLSFFVCSCADSEKASPTGDSLWDHPDEATIENPEVLQADSKLPLKPPKNYPFLPLMWTHGPNAVPIAGAVFF